LQEGEKTKQELKNITVFGRHNRFVPVYTQFDATQYKNAFSPERMQGVTAKDAIIDPH
jgi:hypothetical protein